MLAPPVRSLLALLGALAEYPLACGVLLSRLLRMPLVGPSLTVPISTGTMIVIESDAVLVGSRVRAEATSVLPSPSGKMIFSRVDS